MSKVYHLQRNFYGRVVKVAVNRGIPWVMNLTTDKPQEFYNEFKNKKVSQTRVLEASSGVDIGIAKSLAKTLNFT